MKRRLAVLTCCVLALVPRCLPVEPAPIPLPNPNKTGGVSVETALAGRRSIRAYAKRPLILAEVGQLSWAAQGITSPDGKRTAPSAMHRYPLEIAVVAQNVEGLRKGAYRYVPAKHALEMLTSTKPEEQLLAPATSQGQVQTAPAVFVIAAVYGRMGPGTRNHTWTDYEAGLASENLMLEAAALGLGSVVTGGIDAGEVKEAVKFTNDEEVIVVIPVGHPAQ